MVIPLPVVYRCKNCGYVFHYLEYVGQDYIGVPSVNEILGRYGYTCPKCKSRLSRPAQSDIMITSISTAKKKNLMPIKIGDNYYVRVPSSILDLQRNIGVGKQRSEIESTI